MSSSVGLVEKILNTINTKEYVTACSQKWIASQKAKDDGDAYKERCWKCGVKNNYTEKKAHVKFRALTFPVTCLNTNETRAVVQLTGSSAKKFEKILKNGAKIEDERLDQACSFLFWS